MFLSIGILQKEYKNIFEDIPKFHVARTKVDARGKMCPRYNVEKQQ